MVGAELFKALGDPTRLEIIRRLSNGDSYTISTVSSGLPISRQGVRKHLKLLADAKVITLNPRGRDTTIRLERVALQQGRTFIAKLESQWDERLKALKQSLEEV